MADERLKPSLYMGVYVGKPSPQFEQTLNEYKDDKNDKVRLKTIKHTTRDNVNSDQFAGIFVGLRIWLEEGVQMKEG